MTTLKGIVERQTIAPGIGRPVIVTLDAETKRIGFREKGRHKTFWIPIATAFVLAVRAEEKDK